MVPLKTLYSLWSRGRRKDLKGVLGQEQGWACYSVYKKVRQTIFFCIERESKNVNILQQLKHEKQHIFENVIY